MAYIGNSPANIGNYQIVDDIASGFNGSLVSFALASGGIAITPAKSGQILANINGVMQEPDDGGTNGFKVTGSNIVFSSAPANGDTFWAVYQGQNVDIGTPSDDVVDTAHIKDEAVTAAKLANAINTAIAANTAKTGITTSQASAITANTAKTGITSSQSSAITANTAKTGITSSQASAITANTAKTGITSSQATAITAALPKSGGTMTGTTAHGDGIKSTWGTAPDLEIYHNAGDSYIADVGDGGIKILTAGVGDSGFYKVGGEKMATFEPDASVTLYHDNNIRLVTTNAGATVTGALTATSFAGSGAGLTGLTATQMPAGSVLQVKTFSVNTSQNISNTALVALTDWDFTITKVKSNSKIICFFKFYLYYSANPIYWWIRAYANNSLVDSTNGFQSSVATHNHQQYSFGTSAHQSFNGQFHDSTNASSVNFTFKAAQNASGSLVFWGDGHQQFIFMEIAV